MELKFDARGLIPAIAQDRSTGQVRMLGFMNQEAISHSLKQGVLTFYSRSRECLWVKGESSGHLLKLHQLVTDCDRDAILALVEPVGPTCHTGAPSCFYEPLQMPSTTSQAEQAQAGSAQHESTAGGGERYEPPRWLPALAAPISASGDRIAENTTPQDNFPKENNHNSNSVGATLSALSQIIRARAEASSDQQSYTRQLLNGGEALIGAKIREESEELAQAIREESGERVTSEAADLLYHLLVGLELRGLGLSDVCEALAQRFKMSGLQEKASRNPGQALQ